MNKAIVVLASNIEYLKALVINLPRLDCDFIVCYESRVNGDIDKISSFAPDIKVIDSKEVVNEFAKLQDTEFLHSYSMGMNILLQWYIFKTTNYNKVLFTEDDVILTEDINKLFDEDNCKFYYTSWGAHYYGYPKRDSNTKKVIDGFGKIYDIDFKENMDIFKNSHILSGQRYYVRGTFDLDYYEDKLLKFFNSDDLSYVWNNRKKYNSYLIDEVFEGLFTYFTNILNSEMKHYCKIEVGKPDKVNFNRYSRLRTCNGLWHNATSTNKPKWYDELRAHDLIK